MEQAVSRTEFRDAMARVCAPVNVITTNGPAGRGGGGPGATLNDCLTSCRTTLPCTRAGV